MYINIKSKISEVLLVLLLIGYPLTALAATTFEQTTGLNFYQAVYAFIMGFWGAVASLSRKVAIGSPPYSWVKVIFADITNATLAATITYMACVHTKMPPPVMGIACALAGFGGIAFMDWAYKKFMAKVDKATG